GPLFAKAGQSAITRHYPPERCADRTWNKRLSPPLPPETSLPRRACPALLLHSPAAPSPPRQSETGMPADNALVIPAQKRRRQTRAPEPLRQPTILSAMVAGTSSVPVSTNRETGRMPRSSRGSPVPGRPPIPAHTDPYARTGGIAPRPRPGRENSSAAPSPIG